MTCACGTYKKSLLCEPFRLSVLAVPLTEGIRDIIVAAAAAEKHQRHEPTPNEKGKKGSEAKCDPAVLPHLDAAAGVPH
jgi:hypothetical protein